ncbi:MAG: hypothetical protein MZV64_29890 [Ignavibacteriales bacterium]|nr:hypothetical protein [Ignavibacteriales bacterium]
MHWQFLTGRTVRINSTLKLAPMGLLFAFFGALGQALGLVLSKLGMGNSDPFVATQVRLVAGLAGFVIIVTFVRRWRDVFSALSHRTGLKAIFLGSFFGPFLGVLFFTCFNKAHYR